MKESRSWETAWRLHREKGHETPFAMKRFLSFDFLPRSTDGGLLILRVVFGGALFWLHGWGKLTNFADLSSKFQDPLGVGHQASLVLALFAEVVCAGLIVLGAFTRFAALGAGITMAVAFALAHGGKLSGPGNGQLAFVYLAGFATLLVTGAGRFSWDAKLGGKA
jgi:putative oxidoreductase